MIEAAMIWNEPNNKSHWDPEVDPGWVRFAEMVRLAGEAIRAEVTNLPRVLGGISPIDPNFVRNMAGHGVLDKVDIVAVHGFPIDWNLLQIDEWPAKLDEIRAVTDLPVWVAEVGVSSFGAEEVQAWGATTRHKEAEGSSYYRHFYMGLLRENGTPKRAADMFAGFNGEVGLCQWFHFEDPRLDDAVAWMKRLGVRYLRTGISWADSFRPNALQWFDRQMEALADFRVTHKFCFTPEHREIALHHTSVPKVPQEYADFCAGILRRYAGYCTGEAA